MSFGDRRTLFGHTRARVVWWLGDMRLSFGDVCDIYGRQGLCHFIRFVTFSYLFASSLLAIDVRGQCQLNSRIVSNSKLGWLNITTMGTGGFERYAALGVKSISFNFGDKCENLRKKSFQLEFSEVCWFVEFPSKFSKQLNLIFWGKRFSSACWATSFNVPKLPESEHQLLKYWYCALGSLFELFKKVQLRSKYVFCCSHITSAKIGGS